MTKSSVADSTEEYHDITSYFFSNDPRKDYISILVVREDLIFIF